MKTLNATSFTPYVPLLVIIVVLFAVSKIFKGAESGLEALNLKDTAEEKQAKRSASKADARRAKDNPFDPAFLKMLPQRRGFAILLMTQQTLQNLSNELVSAGGTFGLWKNQEGAVGVFRQFKTQSQVSQFAERFFYESGKDLLTFLRNTFEPENVAAIVARVDKLDVGYVPATPKRFDGDTLI